MVNVIKLIVEEFYNFPKFEKIEQVISDVCPNAVYCIRQIGTTPSSLGLAIKENIKDSRFYAF